MRLFTAYITSPRLRVIHRKIWTFYVGVMGLRLVKKSVNQDVTHTYHLFYADEKGTPGHGPDLLPVARHGARAARRRASRSRSRSRLLQAACRIGATGWHAQTSRCRPEEQRFGETVLPFSDPHGLPLSLVETSGERPFTPWPDSPVPVDRQVRGHVRGAAVGARPELDRGAADAADGLPV